MLTLIDDLPGDICLTLMLVAGPFLTLISAPVNDLPGINLSPLWWCISHPGADPKYDLHGGMSHPDAGLFLTLTSAPVDDLPGVPFLTLILAWSISLLTYIPFPLSSDPPPFQVRTQLWRC